MTVPAPLHATGKDDWATPPEVVAFGERVSGPFDVDAAALRATSKAPRYYGPDHLDPYRRDFLKDCWHMAPGTNVWANPPYSRAAGGLEVWCATFYSLACMGVQVTALIFARTETVAWHDYVAKAADIYFFKGRLSFIDPATGEGRHPAPAPSCMVVWRPGHTGPPRHHYVRKGPDGAWEVTP